MTCRGHSVLVGCMAIAVLAACGSSARSRSTPTSTGPASAATVTSTPSTTITESTSLQPDGLSFWGTREGLVVARVTTPACLSGSAARNN